MTEPEPTRAVLDALRADLAGPQVTRFLAELDIATVTEAIDAGITTLVGDDDLRSYCRIAAVTVSGAPFRYGDEDVNTRVAILVGGQLCAILVGDEPYFELDGDPFLRTPFGEQPVTDDLIRHLLWLFSIMTEPDVAERLLGSVPAEVAADAAASAARSWETA